MFVAGITTRGPDGTSHLITSLSDFEDIFGGYTSDGYVHQTIKTFFEEGGSRAYVSRAVEVAAEEADCSILSSGTECVNLLASGVGTWANTSGSNGLSASVGYVVAATSFKVQIRLDNVLVWTSATHTSVADFIDEVNNDSTVALYVTATAGASTGLPTAGAKTFSGGTNGNSPSAAEIATALDAFTSNLGPGAVCTPGHYDASLRTALLTHAAENNRIAIMSFAKDDTYEDAISDVASYSGADDAEFGAFFFPWVKVPNGSLTMVTPPEGYVCAKRARIHNQFGAWNPYAGERTEASYVTGVYQSLSKTAADALDAGFINPVRVINGTVRVYGARSASDDTSNFRFIMAREVLNQITYEAESALEALLFLPIDGRKSTFARVQATLVAIMDRIRIGGGLYEAFDANGKQIDQGYTVQVNDANNPLTQLATGVIKAKIGARVSSIGDTIEVEITKSNLTASLV
jgi:hypothetical protein